MNSRINSSIQNLTGIVNSMIFEIDLLVNKSTSLGLNASASITDQIKLITAIPINVLDKVKRCNLTNLQFTNIKIQAALNEVNVLLEVSRRFVIDIQNCEDLFCIAIANVTALPTIAAMEVKADQILTELVANLGKFSSDTVTCVTDVVDIAICDAHRLAKKTIDYLNRIIIATRL